MTPLYNTVKNPKFGNGGKRSRVLFTTWLHHLLGERVALWCLEKVQQNPAGESGSWLGVLLAAGCGIHCIGWRWRSTHPMTEVNIFLHSYKIRDSSKFKHWPGYTYNLSGWSGILNCWCRRGSENKAFTTSKSCWHLACAVVLYKVPNPTKQHGWMGALSPSWEKKRSAVGRGRHVSGTCTKRTEASWIQIKYAVVTLPSDRGDALYSLVLLPTSQAAMWRSVADRNH